MNITKRPLAENKEIYFIENKSMKSIIVWFMFFMPLNKTASENALISNILLRGCEKYTSTREMSKFLNESYGSIIGTDVNLKGEVYTLGVHINYINPDFDFINENITESIIEFLENVIYHSMEENGQFNNEYFETEKKNLLLQYQGRINDKDSYAFDRAIEVMCKDEAYSIDKLGDENTIKQLTNKNCFERYQEIVTNAPLKVYVMGNVEINPFEKILKNVFKFKDANALEIQIEKKSVLKVKEVFETIDTSQGKLVLGFRTSIDVKSNEFAALSIVNRLFGGGPESKLFINLREKESLCYTIYSTIEKHKGMMFVACGIDPSNKDIAVEKIINTLDSIKNGDFTDEDLRTCKAATRHGLISIKDNKYTYIGYLQGLNIYEAGYSLDDLCENIKHITRDEVINASNTIVLDTVYFLGRGEQYEN
ncbi:MAG: insulinase family protein [Clostridium sp.]